MAKGRRAAPVKTGKLVVTIDPAKLELDDAVFLERLTKNDLSVAGLRDFLTSKATVTRDGVEVKAGKILWAEMRSIATLLGEEMREIGNPKDAEVI